jgi:hypothetical protein
MCFLIAGLRTLNFYLSLIGLVVGMLFFPLARFISKVLVTKEKQNSKGI